MPSLTGLRFWAALLVVLYHLSRQVGTVPWVSEAAWYGRSGVTFFFVLSGFVLAWTYEDNRVPAKVFLWRRFARIWPMLVLSVFLSVAAWMAMDHSVSRKAVAATLFAVHAWIPEPVYYVGGNPAAWSLSDEAWFYLTFPLLLALFARRRGTFWAGTAVLVSVGAVVLWVASAAMPADIRGWALDYFPLTRSLQFVLGVVAGLAVKRGWCPPIRLIPAVALVVCWHLALVPWHHAVPDAQWYSPYAASQLLSAPLFAALICAAARADQEGRPTGLGGRWSIRLGHWSFAWYLVHEIVIRLLIHIQGRPDPEFVATLTVWLLAIGLSLALAGLCYEYVERPTERLLRRLGPSVVPAAAPGHGGTAASEPSGSAPTGRS
ncbi:acyltransferase [Streptomyces sp. NPDC005566]|uniref:acyltransferase family protein n=1 Tax=Streptomyces sp. NPDC005566 TaxID=3156886 RepID=UPI0033ACA025